MWCLARGRPRRGRGRRGGAGDRRVAATTTRTTVGGTGRRVRTCRRCDQRQGARSIRSVAQANNGGFGLHMWATVVDRSGIVRVVAFSGTAEGDQWPASRVISAQKANTANSLSLDGLALSTANLYSAVQPGGSLFGLQESNPVNTDVGVRRQRRRLRDDQRLHDRQADRRRERVRRRAGAVRRQRAGHRRARRQRRHVVRGPQHRVEACGTRCCSTTSRAASIPASGTDNIVFDIDGSGAERQRLGPPHLPAGCGGGSRDRGSAPGRPTRSEPDTLAASAGPRLRRPRRRAESGSAASGGLRPPAALLRQRGSSRPISSAWAGFMRPRAASGSNHAQRSTSGYVIQRPEPGGHSTRAMLLTMALGVRVALPRPGMDHLSRLLSNAAERRGTDPRDGCRSPPRTLAVRRRAAPRPRPRCPWESSRHRRPGRARTGRPDGPGTPGARARLAGRAAGRRSGWDGGPARTRARSMRVARRRRAAACDVRSSRMAGETTRKVSRSSIQASL